MLGFELTVNGTTKRAAPHNGVVTINFTRVKKDDRDEIDVNFGGYESKSQEHCVWYFESLREGDSVIVKVIDVDLNSEPKSITKLNPAEAVLEGKLRSYRALKNELEAAGMI
jgi:hypothetical protein